MNDLGIGFNSDIVARIQERYRKNNMILVLFVKEKALSLHPEKQNTLFADYLAIKCQSSGRVKRFEVMGDRSPLFY